MTALLVNILFIVNKHLMCAHARSSVPRHKCGGQRTTVQVASLLPPWRSWSFDSGHQM